MKRLTVLLAVFSIIVTPLYAYAHPSSGTRVSAGAPSMLEAAEIAASSGTYRAQNTSTITTGRIRDDDKKRSAIAFAISGAAALAGAGLWRWLPCRNVTRHGAIDATNVSGYFKCYTQDDQRKGLDTPTKAMLGAGIGLEVLSLFYLIAHMRADDN